MCRDALYSHYGINCTGHQVDLRAMSSKCSVMDKMLASSFVVGEHFGPLTGGENLLSSTSVFCHHAV